MKLVYVTPVLCLLVTFYLFQILLRISTSDEEMFSPMSNKEIKKKVSWTKLSPSSDLSVSRIYLKLTVGKKELQLRINNKTILEKRMLPSYTSTKLPEPETYAGIYLTVFEKSFGALLKMERFLTFQMGGGFDLYKMLSEIQPGRIVVLASLFESFRFFPVILKSYLRKVGSVAINSTNPGDRWVMVWTKGGRVWSEEKLSCMSEPCVLWQGGTVAIEIEIPKTQETECVSWPSNESWLKRKRFCSTYEGYGKLCSCDEPLNLHLKGRYEYENMENVSLLIISSKRPFTLSRCTQRLYSIKGFDPGKVLVSVDNPSEEVRALVSVLNFKFVSYNSNISDVSKRITDHYLFALSSFFSLFSWAQKVIVLEEDLFASDDFFSYFSQLASLLDKDKSLYCISAWNDFGFSQTSSNVRSVQRTDTMPGLGWMMSRELFHELQPKWPDPKGNKTDWDMWMRLEDQKKGRHCLIPEVSRTFHFGREGVHTSSQTQYLYYDERRLAKGRDIKLENLERLRKRAYERNLIEAINSSVHLDTAKINPCEDGFLPRNQNQSYTLWFKLNHIEDTDTWKVILMCLGMWSPDVRGGYNKAWQLRYFGTELFIIGWPASKYAYLKPKNILPVRKSSGLKDETEPPIIVQKLI